MDHIGIEVQDPPSTVFVSHTNCSLSWTMSHFYTGHTTVKFSITAYTSYTH